jgi:hypothetical protein
MLLTSDVSESITYPGRDHFGLAKLLGGDAQKKIFFQAKNSVPRSQNMHPNQ